MTASESVRRRPGPSLRLALVIMAVGVLIGAPCAVKMVTTLVGSVSTEGGVMTPTDLELHLDPSTYMVFERTGTQRGIGGGFTFDEDLTTVDPSEVVVKSPTGRDVLVQPAFGNETITRGTRIYTAAVAFEIETEGDYVVSVKPESPTEVLVAESLSDTFIEIGGWFFGALGGGLVFLVGGILLIVGAVRRQRENATPAFAPPLQPARPPPGWYPDPGGVARLRYFDGSDWTEHVSE